MSGNRSAVRSASRSDQPAKNRTVVERFATRLPGLSNRVPTASWHVQSKIYVLDQNAMRKPQLRNLIQAEPRVKFVIPDTALLEMSKSDQWEETFRRSFEILHPVVTRCLMSRSVQEARNLERKYGRSAEGHLLDDAFTEMLRCVIFESQAGGGPTMDLFKSRMPEVREELRQNELSPQVNRQDVRDVIETMREELTSEETKLCKRPGLEGRVARLRLAQSFGDAFFVSRMKRDGVPDPVTRRLWKTKSVSRRWWYLIAHHALQWIGDGGVEVASDKVIVNDVLDQDYVLLGSFFDGVMSFENDVQNAWLDLLAMLALPPSVNAPVSAGARKASSRAVGASAAAQGASSRDAQ